MLLRTYFFYATFFILAPFSSGTQSVNGANCKLINSSLKCEYSSGEFLKHHNSSFITSLIILHSDLSSLTTNDFSQFEHLRNISISNSSIVFPSQEHLFSNVDNLTELEITKTDMREDIFTTFADNTVIRVLKLSGNKISAIKKTYLSKLYHVQEIDLSNNQIEHIEENTFQKLSTLKKLNLSGNNIGQLFDTTYVSLASTMCAICKPDDDIKVCSSFDLSNCKVNYDIDQLWWISHAVNIQLRDNPICSVISGVSNETKTLHQTLNQIPNDSTDVRNKTCRVYEYGFCFKHESRRMFLLEVCGASRIIPSPIFRRKIESITQVSLVSEEDRRENVDLETMLLSAGFPTLLIAGVILIGVAAVLGSLVTYLDLKKDAKALRRKQYTLPSDAGTSCSI